MLCDGYSARINVRLESGSDGVGIWCKFIMWIRVDLTARERWAAFALTLLGIRIRISPAQLLVRVFVSYPVVALNERGSCWGCKLST